MRMPRSLRPIDEAAPVDLGFEEGAEDSEDHSFAVAAHADGDEGGAIFNHTVDTNFVVGGIESQIEDVEKEASTPSGDVSRANIIDIQGGDGGFERLFASGSLLEKGGAESRIAFKNLGDNELEPAHGGLETARFKNFGVAVIDVALIESSSNMVDSFEKHGVVDEEFQDSGDGVF